MKVNRYAQWLINKYRQRYRENVLMWTMRAEITKEIDNQIIEAILKELREQ